MKLPDNFLTIVFIITCSLLFIECDTDNEPCTNEFTDNKVENLFNRKCDWIAGDVATSLELSNGNVIWMFGDSYVDNYDFSSNTVPCFFNYNNALVLHPKNNYNDIIYSPGFFDIDSNINWPRDAIEINGYVYVWVGSYDGSMNILEQNLVSFATNNISDYSVIPIEQYVDIEWKSGFIKSPANNYVYVYGTSKDLSVFGTSPVFVSRFSQSNLSSSWEYWDGNNWNTDITQLQEITYGILPNLKKINDKYIMISQDLGGIICNSQSHNVYLSTSNSPTGPFSTKEIIYTIPPINGIIPRYYSCVSHPEIIDNSGKTLITYCVNEVNTDCHNCEFDLGFDPNLYTPKVFWYDFNVLQ